MLAGLTRRSRGDLPPAERAAVVLVPVGEPPASATIRRAVAEAGGGVVAVVALLRIHGSAWGFPHPGLLPSPREKAEARQLVERAIAAVERRGGHADGQVIATRHPARAVAATARRRGARLVVIERPRAGRVRTALEGDLGGAVRRRLRRRTADPGSVVEVEIVDHLPGGRAGQPSASPAGMSPSRRR